MALPEARDQSPPSFQSNLQARTYHLEEPLRHDHEEDWLITQHGALIDDKVKLSNRRCWSSIIVDVKLNDEVKQQWLIGS